jgi:sulfatase modifying factor 1
LSSFSRPARATTAAALSLSVFVLTRCGLSGDADKHRCVMSSDCLSPRVCVSGFCRNAGDGEGGTDGFAGTSSGAIGEGGSAALNGGGNSGTAAASGRGGSSGGSAGAQQDDAGAGATGAGGDGSPGGASGSAGGRGGNGSSGSAGAGGGVASGGTAGKGGAGSGGASSGAAGSGGDAGKAGGGGCPEMVRLPDFCIDSVEVSRSAYVEWLMTEPSNPMNYGCESNESFEWGCEWVGGPEYPATCVDWCDAYAYCQAYGKRLCGDRGGGPAGYDSYATASENEWFTACTSGNLRAYPYGDLFEEGRCGDTSADELRVSGSFPNCQASGEYACVFDLSGNVWEWEDACESDLDEARCRVRGGSFKQTDGSIHCAYPGDAPRLNNQGLNVGFRCCADDC